MANFLLLSPPASTSRNNNNNNKSNIELTNIKKWTLSRAEAELAVERRAQSMLALLLAIVVWRGSHDMAKVSHLCVPNRLLIEALQFDSNRPKIGEQK